METPRNPGHIKISNKPRAFDCPATHRPGHVSTQEDLDYVAWKMNDPPRTRLDYLKLKERIEPLLFC